MRQRQFRFPIMPEIQKRWSPRAFDPQQTVDSNVLLTLLEAASYAPSCFNEQPWRFIVAQDEQARLKMLSILTKSNRQWAVKAPVLVMLISKKHFDLDQSLNFWHLFDAGTAWGYLSLEAQRQGLVTHAMGGFLRKKARETFQIDEAYEIACVIAIGYYGRKEDLPSEQQENEYPQTRREVTSNIMGGIES